MIRISFITGLMGAAIGLSYGDLETALIGGLIGVVLGLFVETGGIPL